MNKPLALLISAAIGAGAATFTTTVSAEGKTIGVSWSNFQEERWKTDEAAMKAAIEAAGDTYISADAQSSASKQLTDVEALIAQGADALILLAQDSSTSLLTMLKWAECKLGLCSQQSQKATMPLSRVHPLIQMQTSCSVDRWKC